MAKYTIGIDFGTLSGRAVLVDVKTGKVAASSSADYPHGVMDKTLPDGTPLKSGWALHHPGDYTEVLTKIVNDVMTSSKVDKEDVIGIGVDATSCTVLPVDRDYQPMCFNEKYKSEPNAYIKLWKHHGASQRAVMLTNAAREKGVDWLHRFGGNISSESVFPRLWETMDEAPEMFGEMYESAEVSDYIINVLTDEKTRNSCAAGYKAYYTGENGYPSFDFAEDIAPGLSEAVKEKLPSPVIPIGSKAGELTQKAAEKLGLKAGTPVAAGMVDAHAGVPAAGITRAGEMLIIIGTSTCDMLLDEKDLFISGICGSVRNGILPDFNGFEAGQSSVGDLFSHFIENFVPEEYYKKAKEKNVSIHEYLSGLAAKEKAGESGLLALDWLSGNRSTLVDFDLSALVMGMTMQTRPEEVYRALIEATAFGTRVIKENFISHGARVDKIFATGGISGKNPFLMQIYSDVLNMPVYAVDAPEGPALGSAIFAAAVSGSEKGGYDDITQAITAMSGKVSRTYTPNEKDAAVYEKLYKEYLRLYDLFGRDESSVMKNLRRIKNEVSGG